MAMMKSIRTILTAQKGIRMRFFHTVGFAFICKAILRVAIALLFDRQVMAEKLTCEEVKQWAQHEMSRFNIARGTGYVYFGNW